MAFCHPEASPCQWAIDLAQCRDWPRHLTLTGRTAKTVGVWKERALDIGFKLPPINRIGLADPFRWLGGAVGDLIQAPAACLTYGLLLSAASFGLCYGLYRTNAAYWVLALSLGFVFIAPMMAMGIYEAGRRLEAGEKPRLMEILWVRQAVRQDTAYLGVLLVLIYMFWGQIAQIVYGLSTYQIHRTPQTLFEFAVHTPDGLRMMAVGSIIGGILAFVTFSLVVVSVPMLLDRNENVFVAAVTSVRAVNANFGPLLLWAFLISALMSLSALTGFIALIAVFPILGLASWRAYRALVGARS